MVSPLAGVPTHLDKLDLAAHRDPEKIRQQVGLGRGAPFASTLDEMPWLMDWRPT